MNISKKYDNTTKLLLKILPLTAEEEDFVLGGGSALNHFYFNMPRTSLDIDLTCTRIELPEREFISYLQTKLREFAETVKITIGTNKCGFSSDECSFTIFDENNTLMKIDMNRHRTGILGEIEVRFLSSDSLRYAPYNYSVRCLSKVQLIGGKIAAGLSNQHPRHIFDLYHIFKTQVFNDRIKEAFLLSFLANKTPIHIMLNQTSRDKKWVEGVLNDEFNGMQRIPFTIDDYFSTLEELKKQVSRMLDQETLQFIEGIELGKPVWDLYDFSKNPAITDRIKHWEYLEREQPKSNLHRLNAMKSIFGESNKDNILQ